MKLDINRAALAKLLQRVAGVKGKGAMPILSSVLLQAKEDGSLVVSATDLEVSIRVTSLDGVSVETPGAIAVRADQLREIVKVLPRDEVTLQALSNLRLEITCGSFSSQVAGRAADEFPAIGATKEKMKSFSIHADDLKAYIGACGYAVCRDETRYHIGGIYFHCEKGKGELVAAATDGHRLSVAARAFEDIPPFTVTVPSKGVEELLRLESDHVGIHIGKNSMEVVQGAVFLSIRLVEGDFPEYRNAIPAGYTDYCTVNREALIEAVNRVRLFSAKNSIVFGIGASSMVLCAAKEGDEGTDYVPCETKGKEMSIRLDGRYLLEALGSLGGAEVVLKYRDELSSVLMLPADYEKWDERICVLAALRL